MQLIYSLEVIQQVAQSIVEKSNNDIYLFFGDMGVGKTTLIKALTKILGCKDNVSSPTYSLVNEYSTDEKPIFHFDFYRIKSIEEVYDIGFEDYLSQNAYILIEWPELIKPLWPNRFTRLDLSLADQGKRKINLSEIILS